MERDKKCIVTGENVPKECDACHIVQVKDDENYDVDNGLLINKSMHTLFDEDIWCINPNTLLIDIYSDDEEKVGSIYKYKNKKVNIKPNNIMLNYLKKRWTNYINKKIDLIHQ